MTDDEDSWKGHDLGLWERQAINVQKYLKLSLVLNRKLNSGNPSDVKQHATALIHLRLPRYSLSFLKSYLPEHHGTGHQKCVQISLGDVFRQVGNSLLSFTFCGQHNSITLVVVDAHVIPPEPGDSFDIFVVFFTISKMSSESNTITFTLFFTIHCLEVKSFQCSKITSLSII